MEFKVGDRVVLKAHKNDSNDNPGLDIGSIGEVIVCDPEDKTVFVSWKGWEVQYKHWWVSVECLRKTKRNMENK